MPGDLPLAVEIARVVEKTGKPIEREHARSKAARLAKRHTETDVSVADIADVLREESLDQAGARPKERRR